MSDTCEDIGPEVLNNIINMDELKKNIQIHCTKMKIEIISFNFILLQTQNYFSINDKKALVRITSTGIGIQQNSSSNKLINIKKG